MAAIVSDIKPRYHSFEDHLDRNFVVTLTTEDDLGTVFGGQYDIIRPCGLFSEDGLSCLAGGYRLYLVSCGIHHKGTKKIAIHFLWFRPRENTISNYKHLVL